VKEADLLGDHPVGVHPGVRAGQDPHPQFMSKANLLTVRAESLDEPGSTVGTEHVVGGVPKHRIDEGCRCPGDAGSSHRLHLSLLENRAVLNTVETGVDGLLDRVGDHGVQGDAAPGELLSALPCAVRRAECDVLIISRGGGSLEDLWAFNDEELARAIAACPLPVISAVGHEVDFTIADFVADVRAPTPSGAAEIVVPNQVEWQRRFNALALRICRVGQRAVEDRAQQLDWLRKRLVAGSPSATLRRQRESVREKRRRLTIFARHALTTTGNHIALLARALNSVSPLATLDRGYAIVTKVETGNALLRADEVAAGDDIRAKLSQGELVATIKAVIDEN